MTHIPVLLSAVLSLLDPKEGETVIDATVGLGGHAKAFLERIGPRGRLIGMDADEENLEKAAKVLKGAKGAKVELIHENFRHLHHLRNIRHLPPCDILFVDPGLSSPHLDDPSRGFSFRADGPLDMRFDRSSGMTAAAFIRRSSSEELAEIFGAYGEVRRAHVLARALKNAESFTTTGLAEVVEGVYGWRAKSVLPQVFQALRIAVNDELVALEALLRDGPSLLKPGGRMGVISYHSLEDRLVKRRFRALTTGTGASHVLLTKKAVKPTLPEVGSNPRSRSARFRAIRRVS